MNCDWWFGREPWRRQRHPSNIYVGSAVSGLIDGGEGNDTLKLIGAGMRFGRCAMRTSRKLDVQSGMWSVQSDAYDVINVATGATVTSQLKLAAQGEMTVAMGGMVLVTNGSDAVVAEGVADIENAGLIRRPRHAGCGDGQSGRHQWRHGPQQGRRHHPCDGHRDCLGCCSCGRRRYRQRRHDPEHDGSGDRSGRSGRQRHQQGHDHGQRRSRRRRWLAQHPYRLEHFRVRSLAAKATTPCVLLARRRPRSGASTAPACRASRSWLLRKAPGRCTGGDYSAIIASRMAPTLTSRCRSQQQRPSDGRAAGGKPARCDQPVGGNGNIVVDNSESYRVLGHVLNGGSSSGTLTLNNLAGATSQARSVAIAGVIRPGQERDRQ